MRQLFELGERLQKCADFVRTGSRFVDIGSDHGYLPIWLCKKSRVISAIAADINEGPLSTAQKNAEKYHVKINTVLSNGFENILPEDSEDIVIAGMGGDLISRIISAVPWVKDSKKNLILQPMTAPEKLRTYLLENSFNIVREDVVVDAGKLYSVMLVSFDAINTIAPNPLTVHMGAILPRSMYSSEYAKKIIRGLKNKCNAYNGEILMECEALINKIEGLYLENEKNK